MPKTFADLTPEQKARFQERVRLLKIPAEKVAKKVVIGGAAIEAEGAVAATTPHRVIIKDMKHMKELGGIPDEHAPKTEEAFELHPSLSPERRRLLSAASTAALESSVTHEERFHLGKVVAAFVNGDSTKVPVEAVELANAVHFPQEGIAEAAEDLVVNGEYVIEGPGPRALVFGTITINPGGSIVCKTDTSITAASITKL